jgi:ketosteroid isomerase-like protein
MKTRFYLTGILIFILFPLSAQTYLGKQKDIDQILENITKFSEYVVAADYDNIAASYTKDGKIFPNRLNIISGRADVRKYWVLPEGVRTIAHKITPVEIKVKGKEAYDYGYYEGTTRGQTVRKSPGGGSTSSFGAKSARNGKSTWISGIALMGSRRKNKE